jgi:hypothetical protein
VGRGELAAGTRETETVSAARSAAGSTAACEAPCDCTAIGSAPAGALAKDGVNALT